MPPKNDLPTHEELPEHLFGHQRFRRLTFREHMLEEYPAFADRLREQFAAEDAALEKCVADGVEYFVNALGLDETGLRDLIEKLERADVNDAQAFSGLVSEAMRVLRLSDKDLSEEFGTSLPTIANWKSGRGAPHPAMRPSVFSFLAAEARRRDATITPSSGSVFVDLGISEPENLQ